MKKMRKNKGFTLVELIIVIVILGILAAVAVPAYSGYVKKAHDAAALAQLDAIKTAVAGVYAEEGTVTKIVVNGNGGVTSVEVGGTTVTSQIKDITPYYSTGSIEIKNILKDSTYSNGATWTAGGWTAPANNGGGSNNGGSSNNGSNT